MLKLPDGEKKLSKTYTMHPSLHAYVEKEAGKVRRNRSEWMAIQIEKIRDAGKRKPKA